MTDTLDYTINKQIGIITIRPNGWKKELNLVSWNSGIEKFDIREWNEDHTRMSKGLTLTYEEATRLNQILNNYFNNMEENIDG